MDNGLRVIRAEVAGDAANDILNLVGAIIGEFDVFSAQVFGGLGNSR